MQKVLFDVIKQKREASLKEIRELTTINYRIIRGAIISLVKKGIIERFGRGKYKAK